MPLQQLVAAVFKQAGQRAVDVSEAEQAEVVGVNEDSSRGELTVLKTPPPTD